jgi:uncharacterized protein (TIGR03083 family)
VHRWTAAFIATGAAADVERAPSGPAVVDWTRTGLAELAAALEATDPDARLTTWAGTQPSIFWFRRMAVEAALHRVDAQGAVGHPTPVTTGLAIEGIDELFTVLLPYRGTGTLERRGETIHLHATDPDLDGGSGEWFVTLGEAGLTVEHTHAKGDLAVRGTASDLLLLLWNRSDTDRFQVFGEASLLDRWRAAVTL